MNIHLPAILMWTTGVQGFDTLPCLDDGKTWEKAPENTSGSQLRDPPPAEALGRLQYSATADGSICTI